MKIIIISLAVTAACMMPAFNVAGSGEPGDRCNSNFDCGFNQECKGGVCVKKKEFDFGSGKSGNECNNDADCIGSGKCVAGKFGKKYCTGK